MQIERMIRSVSSSCCVGAVLCGRTHIIGSPEARVNGRLAACAGIYRVFGVVLAGVVFFVSEAGGGDCWTCCGGGGVDTCGEPEG